MAPRRRAPRKSSKPAMAKAKKMVTKQRKAKAKRNMDTFFLKAKTVATITPSQGIATSNYVSQTFSLDPTGSTGSTYLNNAEFNLWRLQYDKFRVNSVKITVTPKANVLDQANAQNNNSFNLSGDGVVHTVIDRDGYAPQSTAIMSRYPSYRKYSVNKKFSRTYAVRYPTGIWCDCDTPANFRMGKELGLTGGISIYAENILEDNLEILNQPWAEVVMEWNIVYQGKTSNSLSAVYDEEGNLIGMTVNSVPEGNLVAATPLTNVRGTLADSRTDSSGNEVPINDKGETL